MKTFDRARIIQIEIELATKRRVGARGLQVGKEPL